MTPSGRKAPGEPGWPSHHTDAPPTADPRSLARGIVAGLAVLLIAAALLVAGPWSTQTRALVGLLGWIVAVLAGTWAYRGQSRRASSATRWLLLLGIVAMAGAATLVFISFGVREVLAGTVIFGASGTGCEIEGQAGSFADGEPVYAVAHMGRVVEPRELVTMSVTLDGVVSTENTDVSERAFDCLGAPLQPPEPGVYRVEVSAGNEVLAAGSFQVTPGDA